MADILLAAYVYVAYPKNLPDEEAFQDVLKDLKEKIIDITQLVEWRADNCQEAESSTERRCSV